MINAIILQQTGKEDSERWGGDDRVTAEPRPEGRHGSSVAICGEECPGQREQQVQSGGSPQVHQRAGGRSQCTGYSGSD